MLRAPARLDGAARELDEYFTGGRRDFDLALDMRLARGFSRAVLDQLPRIGYGSTESYAGVAAAAGRPAAVRAVGNACARNPLPLVVPCHRVVRSDGSLGGYAGGTGGKADPCCASSRPRPELCGVLAVWRVVPAARTPHFRGRRRQVALHLCRWPRRGWVRQVDPARGGSP